MQTASMIRDDNFANCMLMDAKRNIKSLKRLTRRFVTMIVVLILKSVV